MPGEFYIKGKKEKLDLSQVLAGLTQIEDSTETIKARTDNLAGATPGSGSSVADWQAAESDLISLGADGARYKLHSLLLSIHNLVGTVITVRLYTKVKGVERKVYEQAFNAAADPPGLWIVNGTIGIHQTLRVTLQSSDAADNGEAVDYDFMLEEM